jgi:DNA-binding transcriptional LysR family regulator
VPVNDLSQLRSFVEVAERGTVASAADALGYTGPAVSLQLAKLEAQLGGKLFDRVGGRLRLNHHGEGLLPLARQILDLAEKAGGITTGGDPARHLVVAGFASGLAALAEPLHTYAERTPHSIEVREAEDRVALRDLGLGHVDVALTQEYDPIPAARNDRYRYTPIGADRLRLVVPGRHPPSVTVREFGAAPWLVNGEGTQCEAAVRLVHDRETVSPPIAGVVGDNHALLALVAAGHGVTAVPGLMLASTPPGLTVAEVDLGVTRTIHAVTRISADRHDDLVDALRAGLGD